MPHLDPADRITRAYAAEQARKAKIDSDHAENALRIREQVEGPPKDRGCKRCGDPYAAVDEHGVCDLCNRDAWLEGVKDKLSPEEIYPEHFPERDECDDE